MSALRKMKTYEAVGYETAPLKRSAGWLPVVIVTSHGTAAYEPAVPIAVEVETRSVAKNIALFLAAPLIGLVYLVAMPFVGLGALIWIGAKALAAKIPAVKAMALAIAAPFIGLAFVVAMPFLGLGALAWVGSRRLTAR
ncbi:MAG: hypothetical protein M0P95_01630 [Sulfuritalea sp.]|nr:hypothetical protein [Sulfuritalea sp.]